MHDEVQSFAGTLLSVFPYNCVVVSDFWLRVGGDLGFLYGMAMGVLCLIKYIVADFSILYEQPIAVKLQQFGSTVFGCAQRQVELVGRLGYMQHGGKWTNNVTPDSRLSVKFMDDPELAYVMQRYRECHDLIHTVLGMPTHMLGEVAVKWIEALNLKLPMCYGGAVFGAARLRPKQRQLYLRNYLPWAIATGKSVRPLLSVYWEHRWEQNVEDLRKELNITTINVHI